MSKHVKYKWCSLAVQFLSGVTELKVNSELLTIVTEALTKVLQRKIGAKDYSKYHS